MIVARHPTCASCAFYRVDPDGSEHRDKSGECRRNAPIGWRDEFPERGDEKTWAFVIWPAVFDDDWCGEYQRRDET